MPTNGGSKKPSWIDRLPASTKLYQGVGSSRQSQEKANDRARVELAKNIEVHVEEVITDVLGETEVKGGLENETFRVVSKSFAKETLHGSRIGATWFDEKENTYWAYACVEKWKVKKALREKVEKSKEMYLAGLKTLRNAKVAAAMREFVCALNSLNVLGGRLIKEDLDGDGTKEDLELTIRRVLNELVENIQLTMASGRGQTGVVGRALQKPLVVRVIYQRRGDIFPVANIPIKFRFKKGAGLLDSTASSDQNGLAVCRVYRLDKESESTVIGAFIDTDALRKELGVIKQQPKALESAFIRLARAHTSFAFPVVAPQKLVFVAVRIVEKGTGTSMAENEILQILTEAGYRVVQQKVTRKSVNMSKVNEIMAGNLSLGAKAGKSVGARILLVGTASTEYVGSKVRLPDGTEMEFMPSCRADLAVQAIDCNLKEVVASKAVSSIKGFGKTKAEASNDALKKAGEAVGLYMVEQIKNVR